MIKEIIKLIFPPKCIFCGTILNNEAEMEICDSCHKQIPFIVDPPADYNLWHTQGSIYDAVICVCEYAGIIRKSLKKYKFSDKPSYYRALGGLLSEKVKNMTNCRKFDIIVCVPLHNRRENSRGYNQSHLLAKYLSRELAVPEVSGCLIRVRDTKTQSSLDRDKRYANIKDAFKVVHVDQIAGKSVLLVDDILTTGQTANECSRALKAAGASRVTVAVIASGRKY